MSNSEPKTDLLAILPCRKHYSFTERVEVRNGLEIATDGRWIAFRPTSDLDQGSSMPNGAQAYIDLAQTTIVTPVVFSLPGGSPVEILGLHIDAAVAARLRDLSAEVGVVAIPPAIQSGCNAALAFRIGDIRGIVMPMTV